VLREKGLPPLLDSVPIIGSGFIEIAEKTKTRTRSGRGRREANLADALPPGGRDGTRNKELRLGNNEAMVIFFSWDQFSLGMRRANRGLPNSAVLKRTRFLPRGGRRSIRDC